jgi:hypothetical protein
MHQEVIRMANAAEPAVPRSHAEVPIEELARQQGVRAIDSLDDLAQPDSWQSDNEFDDFLADLYRSRRSDDS